MPRKLPPLLCIVVIFFLGSAVRSATAGQTPEPSQGASQTTQENAPLTLHAEATLVLIPVSVTDAQNRFVLGLQKQDFELAEDGVKQQIAHFSGEDAPLSVGLVFDESGSMDTKFLTARDATLQFLNFMNKDDEAFLAEFSDAARVSVAFTARTSEIQGELRNAKTSGMTAMLDAIHVALAEMKKAKNPRKAILIVSDGGDNHSHYTADEIESLVREADVQIYAMGVFDPLMSLELTPEEISGPRLLSQIATQTGGRAYAAALASDLPGVTARIAIELRNQYVLAYYSTNQAKDGAYRHVQVKVARLPGMPPLKAHWRQGYYAPTQ